jgi:hypothetical protein
MESVIMGRKTCKKCNRGKLDVRAKRSALVKVALFWLPLKRYQCNYCYKKSYVLGSSLVSLKKNELQPQ